MQQRGLSVSSPIPSLSGSLIESISNGQEAFLAVCFTKAPGNKPNTNDPNSWNTSLFINWGKFIGSMHAAARAYPSSDLPRQWSDDPLLREVLLFDGEDQHIRVELEKLLTLIERFEAFRNDFGVIHADCHQGNIHLDDHGNISLFDFADSCQHWFDYDISVPLFHFPFGSRSPEQIQTDGRSFFQAILAGYHLTSGRTAQLPRVRIFLLLRNIQLYGHLKRQLQEEKKMNPMVAPNWWMEQVRARILQQHPVIEPL